MALVTTLRCPCGKEYLIYVPKRVLYKEIFRGGGVELGRLLDEHSGVKVKGRFNPIVAPIIFNKVQKLLDS